MAFLALGAKSSPQKTRADVRACVAAENRISRGGRLQGSYFATPESSLAPEYSRRKDAPHGAGGKSGYCLQASHLAARLMRE